jgi:hypothetical protein
VYWRRCAPYTATSPGAIEAQCDESARDEPLHNSVRGSRETRIFYSTVLGLKEGCRLPFDFPGIWFLLRRSRPTPRNRPPPAAGAPRWCARSYGLHRQGPKTRPRRAEEARHPARARPSGGLGSLAGLLYEPKGAKIELDFAPDETPPVEWWTRFPHFLIGSGQSGENHAPRSLTRL